MNIFPPIRPDILLTLLFALIYAAAALYTAAIPQGTSHWWFLAGLMGAFVIAGLLVEPAFARVLLLDLAALTAAALIWTQSTREENVTAARTYLSMMVLGMLLTGAGLYLSGQLSGAETAAAPAYPLDRVVVLLLISGFAIKLALVPFYFWLPRIASASSPMTTALIIATLDMAELGELIRLRDAMPWVFTNYAPVWIALALLSMFGGALLALAQRDLKRMLAFSTIDDMGYLLLGITAGTSAGIQGAYLGAMSHAIFKTLMFGAVGIAERGLNTTLNFDCRGLANRFPVSSAVFITGALGILGVPPLFGFAGRWRLYLTGLEFGGPALVIAMAAATSLALFYYVRAIHRVWLGPMPGAQAQIPAAEPRLAVIPLVILALLGLALGLFPGLIPLAS